MPNPPPNRRSDGTSTPGGAQPRTVRVRDDEWAAWTAAAGARGVTVSELVRQAMVEAVGHP